MTRRAIAVVSAVSTVIAIGSVFLLTAAGPAAAVATNSSYGFFASGVTPKNPADSDPRRVTIGTQFTSSAAGAVSAVSFYKAPQNAGPHTVQVWTTSGRLLATATSVRETASGWQVVSLTRPVSVVKGASYIVAYIAPQGHYAGDPNQFGPNKTIVRQSLTALKGVYTYGSGVPYMTWNGSNYYVDVVFTPVSVPTVPVGAGGPPTIPRPIPTILLPTTAIPTVKPPTSPAPSTTVPPPPPKTTSSPPPPPASTPAPQPAGQFPNAATTGVPAGTPLTAYTGPMTITTANTVIDAKSITGNLQIRATGVKISRSKVVGHIDSDNGGSVTITDTEVDGGKDNVAAITQDNVTMLRVNVHGARQSVTCGTNCNIQNSWLHGQYNLPGAGWHVNGYISNGGSHVLLKHNTVACDAVYDEKSDGGCTGPAAIFGDFDPLNDITFDDNLFVAGPGAYCLYAGNDPGKPYGGNPTNIVVKNNVFQHGSNGKCATYGPFTSYKAGAGNSFTGNTWDNGAILSP